MDKFEAYLDGRLEAQKSAFPPALWNSVRYSVFSGGKRIRPRLLNLTAQALGVSEETSYPLAACVELIHTYTLIHDDLPAMDDDDFRRGQPTNHKLFGEATALLAGDALIPLAFQELLALPKTVNDTTRMKLLREVLDATSGAKLVGGQVAEFELTEPSTIECLESIFVRKTGALFALSLLLPAIAAQAPDDTLNRLKTIGETIGVLFQIADDLEDDWTEKARDFAHLASCASRESVANRAQSGIEMLQFEISKLPPELGPAITPFALEIARKCQNAG